MKTQTTQSKTKAVPPKVTAKAKPKSVTVKTSSKPKTVAVKVNVEKSKTEIIDSPKMVENITERTTTLKVKEISMGMQQDNNVSQPEARPVLAQFDANKFAGKKVVELEGDLATEFVPDKEGFLVGTTLTGIYKRTKKVESAKFTAGRVDDSGKKYRNLHVLADANGVEFGIWGTGMLDILIAQSIRENDLISVTYTGRAKEALEPGHQPPMLFDIIKA